MKRGSLLVCMGALLASPASAASEEAAARLSCRPEAGPGRVLCELEVEAPAGRVLPWADALVVSTPPHAPALRSRYGPSRTARLTPARLRLPIALAALREGKGELRVDARLVTCRPDGSGCESEARRITALVEVGAIVR